MTDEYPSVSVVVAVGPPTPAPPPALAGLARAVAARPDAELVVVDDGTTSAVRAELTRLTGPVRIVHRLLATGPGEALATGAGLAAGRLLVLVDPRAALPDGWLDAAVAPFADDPGIGVVVPTVAAPPVPEPPMPMPSASVSVLPASGPPVMAVRRLALDSVGGPRALTGDDPGDRGESTDGDAQQKIHHGDGHLVPPATCAALAAAGWRCASMPGCHVDRVGAPGSWSPIVRSDPLDWTPPYLPRSVRRGLNVVGLLDAACGVGDAGRRYLAAADGAGIETAAFVYRRHGSPVVADAPAPADRLTYDTNLVVLNADLLPPFATMAGAELWLGRHTVGIWFWELEELPARHVPAFAYVHELWAPSAFIRDALARRTDKPVVTVPLPVPHRAGRPGRSRRELGLPDAFTFLTMFDFGSVAARKNGLGTVRAFCDAFTPGEGPVLVLKVLNAAWDPAGWRELQDAVGGRRDVVLLDGYLTDDEIADLVGHADCTVSLHRAEGFGLGPAEAMAWGRPVVATGYSGNLDFMTADNSFLVPFDPGRVPTGLEHVYPAGATWAEPRHDDAVRLLRRVWTYPDEAVARGRLAQRDIRRTHGPAVTGSTIRRRLAEIDDRLGRTRRPPARVPALGR
jgi:glycosyltransferase involved in cell wall biosynthesis